VRCDPRHAAFSLASMGSENAAARRRVARLIAHARPGVWHRLDDFLTFVWQVDPFLLRGRQRAFESPAWWIEDAATGRALRADVEPEWRRAEGVYITALVSGPLRWLGMVTLAQDDQGATAFRCTPWAQYLLGMSAVPPLDVNLLAERWGVAVCPAGGVSLSVQPLALAPQGAAPLAEWADVIGVRDGRLTFRLSADRYCANLDARGDPDVLLAWLRALDVRDGTRTAPYIATVFERWQQRYGITRIEREIFVLEAQDDPTLREAVAAMPELEAEVQIIAPGFAVCPRSRAQRLERALAARGYLVSPDG
jgi:hypothetical protein